jgi:hypothetical protein
MIRPALLTLLLAALAACAGPGSPDRFGRHDPDADPFDRRLRLFISPSGEPFRAEPGGPRPLPAWFARADRNGDGGLDRAEFRADAEAFFTRLDADRDGVVDGFEVSAYETEVVPEILPDHLALRRRPRAGDQTGEPIRLQTEARGGRGDFGGINLDGALPFGLLGEPHPIMAADADISRSVTRAEFTAITDERFTRLDTAGAGVLRLAALEHIRPARPRHERSRRAPRER